MSTENTRYDAFGRIVFRLEPFTNTMFYYYYFGDKRTVKILNDNNFSNFRTKKAQHLIDGEWVDSRSEEYGETLYVLRKYNEGREIYTKQINLKSNSIYIKHTKFSSNGIPIWVEQYKNQKSIGFVTQKKLLKQWQHILTVQE